MKKIVLLTAALFSLPIATAFAQDIVLGQSVPLSGSNADIGRDMRDGALAVFNKTNEGKMLAGRKIKLVTLDNANTRPRALENTKQLIDQDKAVALFGYNAANTSLDALPLVEANTMAMYAPFTGSPSVRNHANVFTVRSSSKDEVEKIVEHQRTIGATKAVMIYYDDDAGKANVNMVNGVFGPDHKPLLLAVKRGAKLDPAVFADILKNPPHYALLATQFSVVGDLLKASAEKNITLPIATLSFVNPDELMEAYGALARGTIVAQVVPSPSGSNLITNPVVKDCASLLKAHSGAKLNYTSLESCLAAKALVRVIQKVGPANVNRASLLKGLETAGRIDLEGFVLNYSKSHHGSNFVDLAFLSRGNQFSR